MVGNSVRVELNGVEMRADIVEAADGSRVRLAPADCQGFGLDVVRGIPVRWSGKADAGLFVTTLPPVV